MIDQNDILGKILRGETVDIVMDSVNPEGNIDGEIDNLKSFLRQFKVKCGGTQCVFFFEAVTREGKKTLEMNIGAVPHGQREYLAGTLEKLMVPNSPLKISLKEKKK